MSIAAILGSGFGLYGYIPALLSTGAERIALPIRYQTKLSARLELASLSPAIQWMSDEIAALEVAKTVVIALRPDLQPDWALRSLKLPNVQQLLLEKPLASSPKAAIALFDKLMNSQKAFRIGYVFRFTIWGLALRSICADVNSQSVNITWNFMAHHYRHNLPSWKRNSVEGGGAIRFYGIHLIALLAELGYKKVLSSKAFGPNTEEVVEWMATFSGKGIPDCNIVVNTKASSEEFRIDYEARSMITPVVYQADPFSNLSRVDGLDIRLSPLKDLCLSFSEDSNKTYSWYLESIELWRAVESSTLFEVSTN